MVKKLHIAIASALLTGFLSVNATAATLQEAHAQLDRAPATSNNTQVTAHAVLDSMVQVGVPVDRALEVVRSAVSRNFSARELRQVNAEVRTQVQAGAQAGEVATVADQSIDAGNSAKETRNAISAFGKEMRDGSANSQVSGNSSVNGSAEKQSQAPSNTMGQSNIGDISTENVQGAAGKTGAGPAGQIGAGPSGQMGAGPAGQMGAGPAAVGIGSGVGAGVGASAAGIGAGAGVGAGANVGTFNR